MVNAISLLIGWILDLLLGDPSRMPHPIVYFGKAIGFFEHRLNHGYYRRWKGGAVAIFLISLVYLITSFSLGKLSGWILVTVQCILIFYSLAGTTLIKEVKEVFLQLDNSLEAGRRQVARIVGRDTSQLSAQEVRQAALETLAENLTDGVIAPLFWLLILGVPGMLAYKMVNTLDSMIGYRTERYKDFGMIAAKLDDVANWIPARLTAILMLMSALKVSQVRNLYRNAHNHLSPNSGWPEAALALILDCRFGGPHIYFGEMIDKPYIGENARELSTKDMQEAVRINRMTEVIVIISSILTMMGAGYFTA